jgi:V8-like Glu-specific endopeptidase
VGRAVGRSVITPLVLFAFAPCTATLAEEERTFSTPDHPVGEFVQYQMDTGALSNHSERSAVVFAHAVHVPDAVWIRLYFSTVTLDPGSLVRMTSLHDGEVQELGPDGLSMWSNSSAYFNGDTVLFELLAGPRATGVRLAIDQVAAEIASPLPEGSSGQCGICGADDRTLSTEDWACRLMPVGCSASIYNTESCAVTAGHCTTSGLVVQFKVPASLPFCDTVNPPVNDQFPVVTFQKQESGVGKDWGVLTIGSNGLGERPFDRYGVYRPIATGPAAAGNPAEIVGYGVDQTCTKSQVQQRSPGQITDVNSASYETNCDVRNGSSGSPLIVNNRIVGILTHCSTNCPPNYATRTDVGAFVTARAAVCPTCLGDLNGDGKTDQSDLGILLASFGCTAGIGKCPGDVDYDGDTDQTDLGALLAGFGCN